MARYLILSVTAALISSYEGGEKMICPRCKGRMFTEKFYDFVRSFDAWKCTCCGEVLDSTIIANRARNNNLLLG